MCEKFSSQDLEENNDFSEIIMNKMSKMRPVNIQIQRAGKGGTTQEALKTFVVAMKSLKHTEKSETCLHSALLYSNILPLLLQIFKCFIKEDFFKSTHFSLCPREALLLMGVDHIRLVCWGWDKKVGGHQTTSLSCTHTNLP